VRRSRPETGLSRAISSASDAGARLTPRGFSGIFFSRGNTGYNTIYPVGLARRTCRRPNSGSHRHPASPFCRFD
jgi:hypothetical protein